MDPNVRAAVNLFERNMNRRKAKRKRQRGARRPPSPPPRGRRAPHRKVKVTALGNATVLRGSIGPATRTWSKLYVPLIFCALGDVPDDLRAALNLPGSQYVSSKGDLRRANVEWAKRLSKWPDWCAAVRSKVIAGDEAAFCKKYLKRCDGKTAAVFGGDAQFGWLPHLPANFQEDVVKKAGVDGEIAIMARAATGGEE